MEHRRQTKVGRNDEYGADLRSLTVIHSKVLIEVNLDYFLIYHEREWFKHYITISNTLDLTKEST